MNRFARRSRDGFWSGIGLVAALYGFIIVALVGLAAWAANPLLGLVVVLLMLHWLFGSAHRRRR